MGIKPHTAGECMNYMAWMQLPYENSYYFKEC